MLKKKIFSCFLWQILLPWQKLIKWFEREQAGPEVDAELRDSTEKAKRANAAQRKVTPFGGRFQAYFNSKFTTYKVPLKMECSLGLEEGYTDEGGWDWGFVKDKKAASTRMQYVNII